MPRKPLIAPRGDISSKYSRHLRTTVDSRRCPRHAHGLVAGAAAELVAPRRSQPTRPPQCDSAYLRLTRSPQCGERDGRTPQRQLVLRHLFGGAAGTAPALFFPPYDRPAQLKLHFFVYTARSPPLALEGGRCAAAVPHAPASPSRGRRARRGCSLWASVPGAAPVVNTQQAKLATAGRRLPPHAPAVPLYRRRRGSRISVRGARSHASAASARAGRAPAGCVRRRRTWRNTVRARGCAVNLHPSPRARLGFARRQASSLLT
jgi:hypothetical protein